MRKFLVFFLSYISARKFFEMPKMSLTIAACGVTSENDAFYFVALVRLTKKKPHNKPTDLWVLADAVAVYRKRFRDR